MTLEYEELKPGHVAAYLANFHKEKRRFHNIIIDLEKETVSGKLDVEGPIVIPERFNLSHPTADIFIQQLVVAYACEKLGKTTKDLGLVVKRFQIHSEKPITTPDNISAKLKHVYQRVIQGMMYGKFEYTITDAITDNSFKGTIDGFVAKS